MKSRILLILFGLIFLLFCKQSFVFANDIPRAKKGILNLSEFSIKNIGIVDLRGEWKYFSYQLIDPDKIENQLDFDFVKVPKNLKGKPYKDTVLSKYGYGTYYLKVILNPLDKNLLLRLSTKSIATASRVFVNNTEIGFSGKVSTTANDAIPALYLNLNDFHVKTDTLNVVIHVSNHHIRKLGLYYDIQLGEAKAIEKSKLNKTAFDLFIVGIIFFMMIYHFVLFFQRRKDMASLYFAIVCLAFGLYTIFITSAVELFIENLPFELAFRLKRASLYLSMPAMALFINNMYQRYFSKSMLKIIIGTCAAFILFTFAFKSQINAYSIVYFRYIGLFFTIFLTYVIVKALLSKQQGARFLFIGALIFTLTIIHDFLYNSQIINTTDISPIGLCFFLFSQSFLLSDKFNKSFTHIENLTQELTYINQNLETIIDERTLEITEQKNEIAEKNEELNQLIEEISTQRDNIIEQKDIIETIYHEISQSIDYAKYIQNSILPNQDLLAKHVSDFFVLFKPKDRVSGDFYWWTHIEGHTLITAADCTGHGVPGAFMSMLGISFLREIIMKEYVTQPAVILRKLRKEIIAVLKQTDAPGGQKDGMDMAIISINNKERKLQYAGAHNPLYIYRNGELIELKGDKMPIAIHLKMDKFKLHEIDLEPNDQLFMFSDGYADQFGGPRERKIMYKPFKELLRKNLDKPMIEQKEILRTYFENWKGENEQIDDVVVIGIKI